MHDPFFHRVVAPFGGRPSCIVLRSSFLDGGLVLRVEALDGVGGLDDAGGDGGAVGVAGGVLDADVGQDAVEVVAEAGGAGEEGVAATKGEVAGVVDGPAVALGVLGGGLGARRVLQLALGHAGAVDEELLPRLAVRQQRQRALGLVEHEGRVVLLGALARGALLRARAREDALVHGAPARVVHGAARVDRDDAEGDEVRVGRRRGQGTGGGGGGGGGGEGEGGELHDGGGGRERG
jgi:uncharacterized membrane protein YgcG